MLRRLGRFQEAIASCDEAVRLDPANSWAQANRGRVLQTLDRAGDALHAYDEAIRLEPGDAWLHTNRGHCLIMLSRRSEAARNLQHAIDLDSEDALEARVMLAALIRMSDPNHSAELARLALEDDGRFLPPFRRGELRALAYLLIADPVSAAAELLSVETHRYRGTFSNNNSMSC